MEWITTSAVDNYFQGQSVNSQNLIDKYITRAILKLNELTCNALAPFQDGTVTGIVAGDGMTLNLPAWFTSVDSVSTQEGEELSEDMWSFTPTTQEIGPDGLTGSRYGKTILLKTEYNTGDTLSVEGSYGFDYLPVAIQNAIIALMGAYDSRESGNDYIKSKSIEDVHVSADVPTDKDPTAMILETQQSVVDYWSLCPDKNNLGSLAYPRKKCRPPYFLGSEERHYLRRGGNHVVGSVG